MSGIASLRHSLGRVESYLAEVEREHLGSTADKDRATNAAAGAEPSPRKGGRRRHGSKRFATGDFIMATLREHPKGMRPTNIAKALAARAPGAHKRPIAVVNTTLARLKAQRQAVNKGGIWVAAKGA